MTPAYAWVVFVFYGYNGGTIFTEPSSEYLPSHTVSEIFHDDP